MPHPRPRWMSTSLRVLSLVCLCGHVGLARPSDVTPDTKAPELKSHAPTSKTAKSQVLMAHTPAPDFMAALRKAVSHSTQLLAHGTAFSDAATASNSHASVVFNHSGPDNLSPAQRHHELKTSETGNDWFADNHVSLVGQIGNHAAERHHVQIKRTCVQDSDTFCEANDLAETQDASLLLNGYADLRAVYGAHIGVNVKF
jgi:hypothetical protein